MTGMLAAHIYSVYDLTTLAPDVLEQKVGISRELAAKLNDEAKEVFELIRRLSDCRNSCENTFLPGGAGATPRSMKKLQSWESTISRRGGVYRPGGAPKAGIGEGAGMLRARPEYLQGSGTARTGDNLR